MDRWVAIVGCAGSICRGNRRQSVPSNVWGAPRRRDPCNVHLSSGASPLFRNARTQCHRLAASQILSLCDTPWRSLSIGTSRSSCNQSVNHLKYCSLNIGLKFLIDYCFLIKKRFQLVRTLRWRYWYQPIGHRCGSAGFCGYREYRSSGDWLRKRLVAALPFLYI